MTHYSQADAGRGDEVSPNLETLTTNVRRLEKLLVGCRRVRQIDRLRSSGSF